MISQPFTASLFLLIGGGIDVQDALVNTRPECQLILRHGDAVFPAVGEDFLFVQRKQGFVPVFDEVD